MHIVQRSNVLRFWERSSKSFGANSQLRHGVDSPANEILKLATARPGSQILRKAPFHATMRGYISLLLVVCAVAVPVVVDESSNVTYRGITRNNLDVFLGIKYVVSYILGIYADSVQDMARILLVRTGSSHPV